MTKVSKHTCTKADGHPQLISAEIIIQEQPEGTYNLGDQVAVSAKIATSKDISGFFQMFLVCPGQSPEFYKEYVRIS